MTRTSDDPTPIWLHFQEKPMKSRPSLTLWSRKLEPKMKNIGRALTPTAAARTRCSCGEIGSFDAAFWVKKLEDAVWIDPKTGETVCVKCTKGNPDAA